MGKLFRVQDNTPSVYYEESRDFQLIGRLYDCIINGLKYDIDTVQNLTDTRTCSNSVLELLKTKLGFFTNETYSDDTLRYMLSVFPLLIKNKGSLNAIQYCINAYIKLNKIKTTVKVWYITSSEMIYEVAVPDHSIVVALDSSILNYKILLDLMRFILPTGFGFYFYLYRSMDETDIIDMSSSAKLIFVSDNLNSLIRSNIFWTTTASITHATQGITVSVNSSTYESAKGKVITRFVYDGTKWYDIKDSTKTAVTLATYGITVTVPSGSQLSGGEMITIYNDVDAINRLLAAVDTTYIASSDSRIPTVTGDYSVTIANRSLFRGIFNSTSDVTNPVSGQYCVANTTVGGVVQKTPYYYDTSWHALNFRGMVGTEPGSGDRHKYDIIGLKDATTGEITFKWFNGSAWVNNTYAIYCLIQEIKG